ncbi:MAG TPA: hypothetical protein VG105_13200 [Paraburkholderia sp.]|nr:hypothetical protein [Paraburkholderia sp.]
MNRVNDMQCQAQSAAQYPVKAALTGTIGPPGDHGKHSAIGKLPVSGRV